MAATMATGNHSAQGELKRTESAATLDAITPAAAVPPAAASEVITAVEATAATSPTREQHMLLPRPTAVQMARINVAATIEDQIGRAVIPSQTNMAETPATATEAATATPTAAIMPAKTKRHLGDGGDKSVPSDGIKFNTDAALSSGYVNATGAWPATTTANIVAVAVAVAAASTISPALTSTAEGISGKTVPTPRLLGAGFGASNVAQILAKSLDSPPPTSASGWPNGNRSSNSHANGSNNASKNKAPPGGRGR